MLAGIFCLSCLHVVCMLSALWCIAFCGHLLFVFFRCRRSWRLVLASRLASFLRCQLCFARGHNKKKPPSPSPGPGRGPAPCQAKELQSGNATNANANTTQTRNGKNTHTHKPEKLNNKTKANPIAHATKPRTHKKCKRKKLANPERKK